MAIALDHLIVASRDRLAAGKQLAGLLGVPWAESGIGPSCPVDMLVNTAHGGHIVHWNQPDGHLWEALTESYARQRR